MFLSDALPNLVPSVQFKKLERHPWRSLLLVQLHAEDWFLCENGLRHERVKSMFSESIEVEDKLKIG